MILIRVQTNLKSYKLNLKSLDITLHELKSVFNEQINVTIDKIIFSYDMNGNKLLLGDNNTLKQLNLSSGSLIYLYGRLIKNEITKSYIDEKGQLISKGITYDIISNIATISDKDILPTNNDVSLSEKITNNDKFNQEIQSDEFESRIDDNIRPADPSRKMVLLDDESNNIDSDILSSLITAGVSQEELLASIINGNNNNDNYTDNSLNLQSTYYNNSSLSEDINTIGLSEDEILQQIEAFKEYETTADLNSKIYNIRAKENIEIDKTNLIPVNNQNTGTSYEYISPSLLKKQRNYVESTDVYSIDPDLELMIRQSLQSINRNRNRNNNALYG